MKSMPDRGLLNIEGKNVRLRTLSSPDVTENYVAWLNDEDTMRYLEYPCGSATLENVTEYISQYENSSSAILLGIYSCENDMHIGNIKLDPIDWKHERAVVGILVGEKSARGHGVGREAMRLCLGIAFDMMNLHRVELGVTEDNVAAIRCYESLGFVLEGRHRDGTKRADGFVDNLHYGMLVDEFAAQRS
jgi:[ribosomal protein S5]-alanine N-acetyltransferase